MRASQQSLALRTDETRASGHSVVPRGVEWARRRVAVLAGLTTVAALFMVAGAVAAAALAVLGLRAPAVLHIAAVANLFVALTDAVQMSASFQTVRQLFGDGVSARNNRLEFGSHFFF